MDKLNKMMCVTRYHPGFPPPPPPLGIFLTMTFLVRFSGASQSIGTVYDGDKELSMHVPKLAYFGCWTWMQKYLSQHATITSMYSWTDVISSTSFILV